MNLAQEKLVHFDEEDYANFLKAVRNLPYLKKNPPKEEILTKWYTDIMTSGTDSCGAPLYAGGWTNAVAHMGLGGSNMGTVLAWYRGEYSFFQSGQTLYQQLRFETLPIPDMAALRLGKATEELNKTLFHEKYKAISLEEILDAVRNTHFEHNEALRVTPDDIVTLPDGNIYIVDYKTVNRGVPEKIISDNYKAQLVQGMTITELLGHHVSGGIISYLDIQNVESSSVFIGREEMLLIQKEMDEARELFWGHLVNADIPPYRIPHKIQVEDFVDSETRKKIQNADWDLYSYKRGKSFFEKLIEKKQKELEELCLLANTEKTTHLNTISIKEKLTPESILKVMTLHPEIFKECSTQETSFSMSAQDCLEQYENQLPKELLEKLFISETVVNPEAAFKICKEKGIPAESNREISMRANLKKEIKPIQEKIDEKINRSFDTGTMGAMDTEKNKFFDEKNAEKYKIFDEKDFLQASLDENSDKIKTKKTPKK